MVAITAKQRAVRSNRIQERAEKRRKELWPKVTPEMIWNRKRSDGFSTVPRTLTLIGTIADTLAEKNKRVSTSYFGLWCRVFDTTGMVTIENEHEAATEAGFTGERRVYTWRDRIKQLEKLEFISVHEGSKGPFQFILIYNPYQVLYRHNAKGNIQQHLWLSLVERTEEVGAYDIEEYEDSLKPESSSTSKASGAKRKVKRKKSKS